MHGAFKNSRSLEPVGVFLANTEPYPQLNYSTSYVPVNSTTSKFPRGIANEIKQCRTN